jgi:hypothetical protein
MLAAEAVTKCFGVRLLGKAEHLPPLALVIHRVSARPQRQAETERVRRSVVRPSAFFGAQHHLGTASRDRSRPGLSSPLRRDTAAPPILSTSSAPGRAAATPGAGPGSEADGFRSAMEQGEGVQNHCGSVGRVGRVPRPNVSSTGAVAIVGPYPLLNA